MPYGTIDKREADYLVAAGFDLSLLLDVPEECATHQIDVVVDGALDQSFLINPEADQRAIVDALCEAIAREGWDDFSVSAAHVYVGEDFIEGSGFMDTYYERRTPVADAWLNG